MPLSSLQWQCLPFSSLDLATLYAILRLRQEVFAVEQNSIYVDADGKDIDALHLFATQDAQIKAYCRLLPPGVKYPEASIGRVLSAPSARGKGAGKALMQKALEQCATHFPQAAIRISAQLYLQDFYEALGFVAIAAPYDEDGIPHLEMLRRGVSP